MVTNVDEKLMKDFADFAQTLYYFTALVFCATSRNYHSQYEAVDVTNISRVFFSVKYYPKWIKEQ